MAGTRMPDAFFAEPESLLPPEEPVGREGDRPRVSHRTVVKVLWRVLSTGCRWEAVPLERAHRRTSAIPRSRVTWAPSRRWP